MKFLIGRTSDDDSEKSEKPCERAIRIEVDGESLWQVEIATLEDLLELKRLAKAPIILTDYVFSVGDHWERLPRIEIYDGYRE